MDYWELMDALAAAEASGVQELIDAAKADLQAYEDEAWEYYMKQLEKQGL